MIVAMGGYCFCLLVATVCDLDWKIIPDQVNVVLVLLGLSSAYWNPWLAPVPGIEGVAMSLLGLITGGLMLLLIAVVGKFFFGREAMGGGDVKLLAGIGAFLGWKSVLAVLALSSFLGSLIAVIGIVSRKVKRRQYIPFGPFISVAAFVEFLFLCGGRSLCDILKKYP